MPERTTLLKPVYSAVNVYWPGASCGIEYSPLSLTTALRLSFVPTLAIVIVAPGTTAPVSSVTRPTTVARNPCAARTEANKKIAITPFRRHDMPAPPLFFEQKHKPRVVELQFRQKRGSYESGVCCVRVAADCCVLRWVAG